MASSSIESKIKPQNWLLAVWNLECSTNEIFRELLAEEPPDHLELDADGWERMKKNCLFQAIEEKNVELVSVLVEQPGFDINATFNCDCDEVCGVKCKATLQPLHVISTRVCSDTCQTGQNATSRF